MEQQTKHENFVAGVVGAVLGSFLGAVCIILVSQLGYVAVISGVVMGVCTLKGYELLGGTLSRKGIVVSLALVLGMTWLAFQMDCAIEVAREAEIDFFEAFRSIGYLLEEGYLNPRYYWGNLIVLYLFTLPGAVPLILGARKSPEEEAVRPAFQRRQVFIRVISHAFPPFCFPLPFSPKRFPAPFLRRVPALARSPYFGTFCPEVRLLAVLPQPGYSFSDGHSVFKMLSIDELP